MEFFELIMAISVTVVLPLSMTKMIIEYQKSKRAHASSSGGVTTSELKALMQEAAEEAVDPLVRRVEYLERQLRRVEAPADPAREDAALPEPAPRQRLSSPASTD